MDLCDATTGCIDVSYSSGRCYMKNTLNSASTASLVWTGRKTIETPLDLTQTAHTDYSNGQYSAAPNSFSLTQESGPWIGSAKIFFPVKPSTIYEVSYEYLQQDTSGQSYYIEVGDNQGILSSMWWAQAGVGLKVNIDPYYSQPQVNTCYKQKSMPQKGPASGSWQTGSFILYARSNQAWFRRDMGGEGTIQWKNVYVREKTNDYCGLPA